MLDGTDTGEITSEPSYYLYGQTPEYKVVSGYQTNAKIYTFNWRLLWEYVYLLSDTIPVVTWAMTYTAVYNEAPRQYTIIFYDEDGETELDRHQQDYWSYPNYEGATPIKTWDAQYSYVYDGWSDWIRIYSLFENLPQVTMDINYTVHFSWIVNEYTITFEDWSGNYLWSNDFPYGEIPVYEWELPTKESTVSTDYTFNGWRIGDSEFYSWVGLPIVQWEATYTVIFSESPRQYEITFVDDDGTELRPATLYNYWTWDNLFWRFGPYGSAAAESMKS